MKVVLFGKKEKFNGLLVIDGVLGLADKSSAFASFLTIYLKTQTHCLYIFQIVYLQKAVLRLISQSQIFNIFSLAVDSGSVSTS